jgi:TIR domain-containing protein
MARPEDRVRWIRAISDALAERSWVDENLVLDEFGILNGSGGGHRDELRIRRLQQGADSTLESLWRFVTGAAVSPELSTLAPPSRADLDRLWPAGAPRVFLSHKAEFKRQATDLKAELSRFGAASFVAHDDIEPTRAWQIEIERALASMDVLIALLTTGFCDSWWTNQEIGVALGRNVSVICVRIDEDPRGFVGSLQAIAGAGRSPEALAREVVRAMSGQAALASALLLGLVIQWESARSFQQGIRAIGQLEACRTLPPELLARVERAYETNDQLNGSAGVNNRYPAFIARIKAAAGRAS